MATLTPFLMFTGRAEEALRFYVGLFPDSELRSLQAWGAEGPGQAGTVYQAFARLAGQEVRAMDSPAVHGFTFTPALSLFVMLPNAAETTRCFQALAEGGQVLMPLGEYPFSPSYGWVQDRFGVSWQLSVG
jgi:predicted 3-demethylubiquinone-9 3-methyltransferase (glyoxalase superfamily)